MEIKKKLNAPIANESEIEMKNILDGLKDKFATASYEDKVQMFLIFL